MIDATVTISLLEYEDLKKSNNELAQLVAAKQQTMVSMSYGAFYNRYHIINPTEAEIIYRRAQEETHKEFLEVTKNLSNWRLWTGVYTAVVFGIPVGIGAYKLIQGLFS